LGESTDLAFQSDRAAVFDSLREKTELIRYLDPQKHPTLGEPGYADFLRDTMQSVFYRRRAQLSETLGERTLLAWRITRELARHTGLLSGGETLASALQSSYECVDPWSIPKGIPDPAPGSPWAKEITSSGSPQIIGMLKQFESKVPMQDWVSLFGVDNPPPPPPDDATDGQPRGRVPGIPLLPPQRGNDSPLWKMWHRAVCMVSDLLGLHTGTHIHPGLSEAALPQLLEQTRTAWPSRGQIMAFEQIVVNEAIDLILEKSSRGVTKELHKAYGLLPHEQKAVVEMARVEAMEQTDFDVNEARGLMVLRLEDYIHRSRENLDSRAELWGLKQLAIIQGLSRSEAGDLVSDFTSVVRSVSQRQTPRLSP
jgi:hypothetical protein